MDSSSLKGLVCGLFRLRCKHHKQFHLAPFSSYYDVQGLILLFYITQHLFQLRNNVRFTLSD